MMRDAEKTIGNLIDKQGVAYIASVSQQGYPQLKAMLPPRKRQGIREFYFTTNTSSMRVAQYRQNPKASIYFCDKRFFRGVMLQGQMEVLEDAASKEMIWRAGDTIYYPPRRDRPRLLCAEICGAQRAVLCKVRVGGFFNHLISIKKTRLGFNTKPRFSCAKIIQP